MKTLRFVPLVAVAIVTTILADVAWAHDVTYQTGLTIRASDTSISPGHTVDITGHLRSTSDRCEAHAKIKLVREGVGVVASTRTDRSGRYVFAIRPDRSATWHTRVARRVLNAVQPHNHVCANATSRSVAVTVR